MKELLQGVHHLVSHILNKEQQLTGSFNCENYILITYKQYNKHPTSEHEDPPDAVAEREKEKEERLHRR
jgi:hypothetical protein